MDEDKFNLVEKVIKDIDNVMSKKLNAELYAFDIIPVEFNYQNKSPVLYLENCLGLESWCVKHVYMYCYSELMDKFFSKPKRKALKITSINSDRLSILLNVTLLLNPELTTFWNKRREMVQKSLIEKPAELLFTKLVLSRKPKSNDTFAYRRWLIETILQDETCDSNYMESLVNEDLHICDLASDKSPNNYHSWNHRMWLLNKIKTVQKQFDINFLYINEYVFSERWTAKHISDFSCFHYRQFCIKNIFTIFDESWKKFENTINVNLHSTFIKSLWQDMPKNVSVNHTEADLLAYSENDLINLILSRYTSNTCNCTRSNLLTCRKIEILFHELVLNNELLRYYNSHETLWYHRRFIIHELISIMYDHFGLVRQNGSLVKNICRECNLHDVRQKQSKMVRYDSNRIYSSVLFNIVLSHEKKFIDERRNATDNYADRHEKYMKFVEGLNIVL